MSTKQVTQIEQFIIDKIREIRFKKGFSQADIENEAGFANGFIGKVESRNQRAKYNFNHINKIAKVLKCSPRDFLPEKPL